MNIKRILIFKSLIFLILVSVSGRVFAQNKFEKESRIKSKNVPPQALHFVNSLNLNTKVKWYKEEGLNRISIEAKFKRDKAGYSVEFDSAGNIEDIEIEINWSEIEWSLRETIASKLQQNCVSYSIVKVQKQYIGSENDLYALLAAGTNTSLLEAKYELIVKCRQQGSVDLFEYLLNDKGEILSKSKIVYNKSSHLEY